MYTVCINSLTAEIAEGAFFILYIRVTEAFCRELFFLKYMHMKHHCGERGKYRLCFNIG